MSVVEVRAEQETEEELSEPEIREQAVVLRKRLEETGKVQEASQGRDSRNSDVTSQRSPENVLKGPREGGSNIPLPLLHGQEKTKRVPAKSFCKEKWIFLV